MFILSSVDRFLFFPPLWLLWVMLSIFEYKFLYGHLLLVLLGIFLEMDLLGYMVTFCLIFWRIVGLLSKGATSRYIFTSSVWVFHSLHIFTSCLILITLCLPSHIDIYVQEGCESCLTQLYFLYTSHNILHVSGTHEWINQSRWSDIDLMWTHIQFLLPRVLYVVF